MVVAHFDNFVNQEEWIAVRKQFANAVDVHHRCDVGVIDRRLHFLALDFAANLLRECGVECVTRFVGNDAAFERASDECDVANHVEQLVASRFVGEHQRLVVDVAQVGYFNWWHSHELRNLVELFLAHWLVVDYDSVVEVAALNEVCIEQSNNFANEHECAAGSNVALEALH